MFNTRYMTWATLSLMFLLSACSKQLEQNSLSKQSIVYCSEGAPETFNPQLITSGTTIDASSRQLFDRLLDFDEQDNSLRPDLATDWHVTDDGTMITFYLRKGVTFHQTDFFTPTRQFTADDVLFSFNRILDPNHPYHMVSGGKYPFFQNGNFSQLVKKLEKINDFAVRFTLTHPDSSFLANLASDFAVIHSAEYAQQLLNQGNPSLLDKQPIGTGPYLLKEYRAGQMIRFLKHKDYWHNQVQPEQLIFDITHRNSTRLTKLLTHECDVIAYPIAQEKIKQQPELQLDAVTSFNVGYFGFNTKKPPFDNRLVRLAIAHAINREALIDIIYQGQAELAHSLLPSDSWASPKHSSKFEYSPLLAKALLEQAGYKHGFTMDIWAMPVQRAYNPNALKMAKLIQADLAQIGVNANIVSYEWNTFLRKLAQGEHQSFLLGWSADHPDPDNFFTPLLSCSSAATGSNRTFWCDQQFDQLLQQALQTTVLEQRRQFYQQAMQLISTEMPLLPIAHSKRYQARHKAIKGNILRPFGGIDFSQVRKTVSQVND